MESCFGWLLKSTAQPKPLFYAGKCKKGKVRTTDIMGWAEQKDTEEEAHQLCKAINKQGDLQFEVIHLEDQRKINFAKLAEAVKAA